MAHRTPDGTADWNRWTLATLSDGSGFGMFLWNQSTGPQKPQKLS